MKKKPKMHYVHYKGQTGTATFEAIVDQADEDDAEVRAELDSTLGIADDLRGMDIGALTVSAFSEACASAGTVVASGLMGEAQCDLFEGGSVEVLRAVAGAGKAIVFGDDTIKLMEQHDLLEADGARDVYAARDAQLMRALLSAQATAGISSLV